jgi:hypothetical protein
MNRKIDIRLLSDLDIDAIKEKPSSFIEEIFLKKYKEVSSSIDNIESTLKEVFTKKIEEDEKRAALARKLKKAQDLKNAKDETERRRLAKEQQIKSKFPGMKTGPGKPYHVVSQPLDFRSGISVGGGKKTNKNKRTVKTQKSKIKKKKGHSNKKTKYKK